MKSNSNPSSRHENFEELAALAAVSELSPFELKYLEEHLAECPECRAAYEAFVDVASNDLGVSAAGHIPTESRYTDDSEARQSLRQFCKRFEHRHAELSLLPSETERTVGNAGRNGLSTVFFRRMVYGLAATVLLTATTAGVMWIRSAKRISAEMLRSQQLQAVVDSLKQKNNDSQASANDALVHSLEDARKDRDAFHNDRDRLQKALVTSESHNAELLARENSSEAKVMEAIDDTERLRQQLQAKDADRERLAKLQQESEGKLREALAELYQARQGAVQTAANAESTESNPLANGQTVSESVLTASTGEVEARNLFGARNLHIVDVYDVSGDRRGNAEMKRAYGRVYYVEKKLLVFYAFDLQNRQKHKPGVFQAWGYHEANAGKAVNMGLFVADETSVGRWVLTVNRPDVLAHVDAVFVTSEPAGGSGSPRGQRILYANLAWPANHP